MLEPICFIAAHTGVELTCTPIFICLMMIFVGLYRSRLTTKLLKSCFFEEIINASQLNEKISCNGSLGIVKCNRSEMLKVDVVGWNITLKS